MDVPLSNSLISSLFNYKLNFRFRFHPVLYRNGLLEIFQEKYTIILQLFQLDLEKVEEEYELQKVLTL